MPNAYSTAVSLKVRCTYRVENLEVALRLFARPDRDRFEGTPHALAFPSLRLRVPFFVEPIMRSCGKGLEL